MIKNKFKDLYLKYVRSDFGKQIFNEIQIVSNFIDNIYLRLEINQLSPFIKTEEDLRLFNTHILLNIRNKYHRYNYLELLNLLKIDYIRSIRSGAIQNYIDFEINSHMWIPPLEEIS